MDEVEENARKNLLYDVNDVITSKWSDSVMQPFGSYPVGLSIFLSDIDVSILGMGVDDDKTAQQSAQQRRFTNEFHRGITSSSASSSTTYNQNQNKRTIVDLSNSHDNDNPVSMNERGGRTASMLKSSIISTTVSNEDRRKIKIYGNNSSSSSKEEPILIDESSEEEEEEVSWSLDTVSVPLVPNPVLLLSPSPINELDATIIDIAPISSMSSDIPQTTPVHRNITDRNANLILVSCDSSHAIDAVDIESVPIPSSFIPTDLPLAAAATESNEIKSELFIITKIDDVTNLTNIINEDRNNNQYDTVNHYEAEVKADNDVVIPPLSERILLGSADATDTAPAPTAPAAAPAPANTTADTAKFLISASKDMTEYSSIIPIQNVLLGSIGYIENSLSGLDDENERAVINRIIEGVPLSQAVSSKSMINGKSEKRRRVEKVNDTDNYENLSDFIMDDDSDDSYFSGDEEIDDEEDEEGDGDYDEEGLTEDEDELYDEECRGSRARINKTAFKRSKKRKAAVSMDLDRLLGVDSSVGSSSEPSKRKVSSEKIGGGNGTTAFLFCIAVAFIRV